jgi:hypothetical protein
MRAAGGAVLGYVIDVWWFESEELRESYVELLARLVRLGKPTALLDEVGGFALPVQFARNPLLQAFRFDGTSGGSLMARHLLSLGHRSVAYISPSHAGLWSIERYEGIEAQFRSVGAADTVHRCTTNLVYNLSHWALGISGLDDKLIHRILLAGRTRTEAEKEYAAFIRFRDKGPAMKFEMNDIEAIKRDLGILIDLDRRNPGQEAFDRICSAAFTAANMRMNAMILTPLFEQARKTAGVTAWICANDLTALAALAYLRKRTISVPADVSVAGFDNLSIAALENRLTSYDFNTAEFIYRMLEFIARPPKPRGAFHHFPVEVEGTVVVRGTTGKPPSHRNEFVV